MSVFLTTRRWPNSTVPYVIANAGPQTEEWFQEINACMGFALLVPRQPTDTSYIQLTVGGFSRSEQIGCKGGGMQTIGGDRKFVILHELFHALGFKHEQLHRKFPWDDSDPSVTRVNRMFTYEGKSTGRNNQTLYAAIQSVCDRGSPVFFADNNLNSRVEALLAPDTEHWADCDLDSVMMYGDFRRALQLAQMDKGPGVVYSGKSGICNEVSNQDIAALRYMYPPPPPVPPRNFLVTFSGQAHDSVRLTFSVRSTTRSSRVSRYTADANGRAVVRGFNPAQAEIRVEPWQFWNRVKIDPETANALPGGRYTYSLTLA